MMRLLKLLLCYRICAALRPTRVSPWPRDAAPATKSPAQLHAATGAAAAAAAALAPSIAVAAATTEAELDDYFSTPHPEFAVALIIHWILWGKFDAASRSPTTSGDWVLFAAEPFFR